MLVHELRKCGYQVAWERVETAGAMRAALKDEGGWDIIFSDFMLPGFGGMEALQIAKDSGLDLPFVILSGKVSEETLVEVMKAGAADMLVKGRLERIGAVVRRELADAAARRGLRIEQIEWRAAFDAVTDPIFFHDAEFRVVRANFAYAALAGTTVKDVIGRYYWEAFPGLDGPLPGCRSQESPQAGYQEEFVLPDGTAYLSRSFPIQDGGGTYLYSLHVLQDLTERNRVRDAVETGERRFRSLIEHGLDLLAVVDAQGVITYISPSIRQMGGYEESEVLGRGFLELAHPEDLPLAREGLAEVLRLPGGTHSTEFRFRHKNGGWVVLHSIARNAIADPAVHGIVVNAHDVTARKEAEVAIRASRDLLGSVVENAPVRVFWKDLDLRYLGCNTLFAHDAGLARQEDLIGKDDFQMVWHAQAAKYQADDRRVLETNLPSLDIEEPQTTPDGRTIWLRTSKVPLHGTGGKVIGMLGVYEDVTDRKQAAAELVRLNWATNALGQANSAMMHAASELELYAHCCAAIANSDAYPLAWIGLARDDPERRVEPVAMAGIAAGYIEGLDISWAETRNGMGPGGRAIRMSATQIVSNLGDATFAPWLDRARNHGLASVIATPIRCDGVVVGVLAVYGRVENSFGAPETKLFEELANNIGYGLSSRRTRIAYEAGMVERARSAEKLRAVFESAIGALAVTVEQRDPYTAGHQRRVAQLAVAIGRELGFDQERLTGLRVAGLIHDIGKVAVPAEFLARPGSIGPVEFELIKAHAQAGYDIVKSVDFPWPVADAIRQHHERIDGSGYPQGLKGEAITLEARILAVADVVEAMSSHRPYRPALGLEVALKEIQDKRGKWFDPPVVDACLRAFREKGFVFELV